MDKLRQAAEMALEALRNAEVVHMEQLNAMYALQEVLAEPANSTTNLVEPKALAQPEQEPVQFKCTVVDNDHRNGIPLSQWGRQPEQEPVGYAHVEDLKREHHDFWVNREQGVNEVPLYAALPKKQWVGLTDEEKYDVLEGATGDGGRVYYDTLFQSYEAKLKEKNGG